MTTLGQRRAHSRTGSTSLPNTKYRFANRLGIPIDCAPSAAAYSVALANGTHQTWSWWIHVTDGSWVPAAGLLRIFA
jgi:hypothetical protein